MQYSWLRRGLRHFALQKCLSRSHCEVRYPYLDRRLLEFALALPVEQKIRPTATRSIVRRALAGRVPRCVLERRTKAGPGEASQRAILRERRWLEQLFAEPATARLGVIDPVAFRAALQRACHGVISQPAQMYRTIALELWLRSLEDEGQRREAHRRVA